MASTAIDTRAYRDLIGRFATGVTVVTVNDAGHYRAMTANAVSSVSLDPLLVLVCIERSASIHDPIHHAGHYALNILAEDQMAVSQMFSRHGELPEPMGGIPFRIGETGTPLIEGTLGWLECEVWREYDGGDHTIFVGRVVDLDLARPDSRPLVFFGGRYRGIADLVP
jgi:flavin reductase (DIM6/NTAB) family NADH-FMN oxidoreductase RutF